MKKAFFIDRDGTINKYVPYIDNIDDFELLDKVSEAIKIINSSEWLAIVVTNQPQVAKGLLSENDVEDMHIKMNKLLNADGARLDGIYYCPCYDCECRKPNQGMYKEAQKIYDDYNDKKENKFHREFYKHLHFEKEDFKKRPDFFEPVY